MMCEQRSMLYRRYSWLDVLAFGCTYAVSVWWSEFNTDLTGRKIMTSTHRRWFLSRALAVHCSLQPRQNRTGNTKSCCEDIDSYEHMLITFDNYEEKAAPTQVVFSLTIPHILPPCVHVCVCVCVVCSILEGIP